MPLEALLSVVAPPLCWACRGPSPGAGPLCPSCRLGLRWLGPEPTALAGLDAWAPVAYEGPARSLVRALKFRGATSLAETMAAQITACAPPGLLSGVTLVPVPAHPWRLRLRGFNQAERLAAALGRRTALSGIECLRRRGPPTRQVGRGRGERLHGISGSVELRPRASVPRRALIVDDVITTGATLLACARVLRAGGAREVAGLAYARTLAR